MSTDENTEARLAALEEHLTALTKELAEVKMAATMNAGVLDGLESQLSAAARDDRAATATEVPREVTDDGDGDEAAGADTGDANVDATAAPSGGSSDGQSAPEPREPLSAAELYTWVERFVLIRQPSIADGFAGLGESRGVLWCPRWWEHPEAVGRLRAMAEAWRAVQATITDEGRGTAEARYYRDMFDPNWRELTSPEGPFHDCTPEHHEPTAFLAHDSFPGEESWGEPTVPLDQDSTAATAADVAPARQ
jgi:hypothetical protein